MKLGAVFPQTEIGSDPTDLARYARELERLGYDHLVAYDHVLGAHPDRPDGKPWRGAYSHKDMFHEPFVLFGYLAAIVHLELTASVIVLPQRQTALVAKQAAEVDVLTGGRTRLGVGIGWNAVEYEALGEDFTTRGRRLEEQIGVLRALWTSETVDVNGRWHTITKAGLNPLPVQRPIPIWMGGGYLAATKEIVNAPLRRIARLADGWLTHVQPEDDRAIARFRELVREAGRDEKAVGLNRLEEPTSGTISVDGRDIESYNPIQLRRGIGYAIQQTGLLPHMTVEENIELVPKLLKWDKNRRHNRTRELLEMVGMSYETFAHRYPRQLSGGQQQRVGVLRALATDPPVILMDEPFGALDPISRKVLQTELRRLQANLHKTTVFVTHDMDEAMRLGDRIAIFREGVLHQVGTPDELVRTPKDEFVVTFIGHLITARETPVESVRQFMQTGEWRIYRELPDGGRIVQIADVPWWLRVDDQGVLRGVAREVPEDTDHGNGSAWMDGEAVCVKETDAPDEVFGRLADEEAEALPVVDERRQLVGVVTRRSAIRTLSGKLKRVEV